ncbi:MAG TPA: aldolase [Lachnospiraceae bacterium]|nr:aldolase [Lachnospiraceae bacterium]
MALKLMYITNDPKVAAIAEEAGVDRIFADMEYIGKADRQNGMDTVQSHHTVKDVRRLRQTLRKAELLVRVNPIHEKGSYMGIPHTSSKEEIDAVIEAGADIVMLPYFKTIREVRDFADMVNGRAKTMALVETVEAAGMIEEIAEMDGIDEVYIGLNDLSLEQGKTFMFQLLADGTVQELCRKICRVNAATINTRKKRYGFGGIAAPGGGLLPAEYIIREHIHLGSGCVILSRSFCNTSQITDLKEIEEMFRDGVKAIREVEEGCAGYTDEDYKDNLICVKLGVQKILELKS